MSDSSSARAAEMIAQTLKLRSANGGRHLHHRDCIHNLAPADQIEVYGHTVEWWAAMGLPAPVQISPTEWECGSPFSDDSEASP